MQSSHAAPRMACCLLEVDLSSCRQTAAESTWAMEVWTLSDEVDAAVFMVVLYGYKLAITTLIRPNGAHTKNFYTQLMSARRLACGGGNFLRNCVTSHLSTPNGL